MELISNYPWYYTLLCIVTGCVFSALLYVRDKHNTERSKSLLYTLAGLRFFTVTLIAFLLLDIFIKRVVNETEKPVVIIAQDNSSSVTATKDSANIKSNYRKDLAALIEGIKDKYEVKTYAFDSKVKQSESFDFEGKETDISQLFSDIENNYANRNIGAVILASDGIYNKGTNPLYSTEKLNAPIYTIALGDTIPLKDAWIQAINHNQVAYLGNSFPAEVIVNAIDLKDKDLTLSISSGGTVLKTQTIHINSATFSQPVYFVLDAVKPGIQRYTINLSVLNEDKNPANNAQSFVIDVIDNRDKILILANAPHPDVAAIEQSITAAQTYEAEVALITNFTKPLKPYALVILHQPAVIPQRISNELKANAQSVFYIGNNYSAFLTGGAANFNSGARTNDAEAVFHKEFPLFTLSTELQNYFKNFPAVKCGFKAAPVPNSTNLLLSQRIGVIDTDEPLMAFNEINGIKSAGFYGDGLWRWKLRDYADHENHNLFNEFITKTVQYLSVKADKSFFRVYTKKIINENEPIDFTAEVYNQSYELITDPDVSLTLKDAAGKTYNYTFSKKQTMYSLSAGLFPAGEYSYEAKVKTGDKLYTKQGLIVVKEVVAEKLNTVANHQLLYQISKQHGGQLYYPSQLKQLEAAVLSSDAIKSITYSHKQLTDLINLRWLFALIVALLGAEWFLRKRNGKV